MQTTTYQAGIGTRVLNFIIDTIIIAILAIAWMKYWKFYVFYYHIQHYNFWEFFFATLFIYYSILESAWGRTPGKWFSFTKVVDASGNKPAVITILWRSALRLVPIDIFFIPFIGMPLHDYLSKTTLKEV